MNKSFLGIALTFVMLHACNSNAQKTNLSVDSFEQKINTPGVQVLDVRTAEEFNGDHIKDALQANWLNKEEFVKRAEALDKSRPVYTYCLSGARSAKATAWLNSHGFEAYNMDGGIKSWRAQGKDLIQQQAVPQISMEAFTSSIPEDKTVLVDVGAKWCPPCRKMDPILDELVQSNGKKFMVLRVDGATQAELVKGLGADEFPTFIIYKNGKPVWKKQGLVSKEELLAQF